MANKWFLFSCFLTILTTLLKTSVSDSGQTVSGNRDIFVNGVPIRNPGAYEPDVYLVVGKEMKSDGSPIDLNPPDTDKLPVEKEQEIEEDPNDPKKRRNFISRDLLEAWKKFAEQLEDKSEVEEKIKKWEPEVEKAEKQMAGSGGKKEGEEGRTEGGEGEGTSTEGGDGEGSTEGGGED